jgi:threonine dehydrogenase-like Zn-dependent dehydrogenase
MPDEPTTGDAIVEATGDFKRVRDALRACPDLGTVILAGPIGDSPPALDLYADVHVRGLTVVCRRPDEEVT